MIKLEIDGVHYEIDGDLRKQIIDLIGGLDEYMDTLRVVRLFPPIPTIVTLGSMEQQQTSLVIN